MSSTLGKRYKLFEMVGTGGMADVYVGEDIRLGRKVAIKILRRDLANDQGFKARFRKEATAAAALSHPNLVSIFDSGEDGADSYIVMELVNGVTLKEYLENNDLTIEQSLSIMEGILLAVQYSHQAGIVHRDLKPSNVMITQEGVVKVMDFGIARLSNAQGETLTSTLNIVGTAQYLSPEQATGEGSDIRSDIYALGCIFYELVTGRPPFSGETPVSVAFQHVSSPLIYPSKIKENLNREIEKIIVTALAKNPSDRYQSANQMLSDLEKVIRGEKVQTQIKPANSKNNLRNIFIGVTLFILIAGGFGIYAVGKLSNDSASIIVPNFIGETLDQAKSFFTGLNVTTQNSPSSNVPVGKIMDQKPLPLTKTKRGSNVLLTISTGPGTTTIPADLLGLSLVDAESKIRATGLQIGQITQANSNATPGTIIGSDPQPGSAVPAGTSINLVIANGQVAVPGVIGNDKVQAATTLTQAGLIVTENTGSDSNAPDGSVLTQTPAAGTSVPIGSTVTLVINQLNTDANSNNSNSNNSNSGN